jgi:hypothetical protein
MEEHPYDQEVHGTAGKGMLEGDKLPKEEDRLDAVSILLARGNRNRPYYRRP